MFNFKTPPEILEKIEACREKKEKVLDLNDKHVIPPRFKLPTIPPEVFSLSHLKV